MTYAYQEAVVPRLVAERDDALARAARAKTELAECAVEVRRIAADVTNDPATAACLSELADRMEGAADQVD